MWEYSDKVKEYFLNPRNVGEVENPDGTAEVGSMACGDALKLTIKVDDEGRISDAKFKTFGCASAIASASALTEMMIGKTPDEAEKITNQDIADFLEGLPKEKMHCSVLGQQALKEALADYRGVAIEEPEGNIVCECFGITDKQIEKAVNENNLTSIEEVTNYTKAGGGCESCHDAIQEIIDRSTSKAKASNRPKLTNLQKIHMVEETIENEIRPLLKKDGGDLDLVDVVGNRVLVARRGTCAVCKASQQTMKHLVEAKLREFVSSDLTVEEVS